MVGGGGGHLFLAIWKTREVGGVKFPLWWGIDIFWNHTI